MLCAKPLELKETGHALWPPDSNEEIAQDRHQTLPCTLETSESGLEMRPSISSEISGQRQTMLWINTSRHSKLL